MVLLLIFQEGEVTTRALAPGQFDFAVVPLQLFRSTLAGHDGYDVEIHLLAEDTETMSRRVIGPLTAHFYAGTEDELARFRERFETAIPARVRELRPGWTRGEVRQDRC